MALKYLDHNKNVVQKLLVQTIFWPEEFCSNRKFVDKNQDPQNIASINLVKMGLMTVEILQMCTNVARIFVAWMNVITTVGLC